MRDKMIKDNKLKIEYVDIKDIKPNSYNPKQMTEKEAKDLEKSIVEFGIVDPLIVNKAKGREGIIIGGHQRHKIYKKLGYKKVPVVWVNIPNLEKEQELCLRLSKNTGSWDYDLLANFDEDLLKDVGWESEELDSIFDLSIEEDRFDVEQEYEKIKKPKVKLGDLYQLGEHRLLCGDATKREDVERLMDGERANMVFTDPPYNIGLDYSKRIGGKRTTNKRVFNDKKSEKEYREFIKQAIQNSLEVIKEDAHIFWWCDERYIYLLQQLYLENGIKLKRVNLWIKNNFNPTPQVAFNKVYEPCVYGTIGKPRLNKNIRNLTEVLNQGLQKADDIYEYIFQGINLWLEDREKVFKYQHTTQKPVTLAEKPVKRCSERGDIILDLFGGSGSTLIACEQLNRKCYMMEIDPKYCDVIINRWEKFSGKKVQKINN